MKTMLIAAATVLAAGQALAAAAPAGPPAGPGAGPPGAPGAPGARPPGAPGQGLTRNGEVPSFGTELNAEQIFEEHWNSLPLAQPMTQEHLSNQDLRLHLYGDTAGIRKSQHPTENYTYTGETRSNWMITLSDPKNYWDLRIPGKVMLRTRNNGFKTTHVALKTADGKWYVSEEGSGDSRAWMNRDYILDDLHWRNLTMVDNPSTASAAVRPKEPNRQVIVPGDVAKPDLSKVEEIGFTDLMPGGFIPSTTRVNAWAVYGKKVAR